MNEVLVVIYDSVEGHKGKKLSAVVIFDDAGDGDTNGCEKETTGKTKNTPWK